uniref:(northern house mosquito) hypothetical protein n=1 Tax=Culex pipiens TaxID=7175 RepID=A0A8D8A5V3_CULPI
MSLWARSRRAARRSRPSRTKSSGCLRKWTAIVTEKSRWTNLSSAAPRTRASAARLPSSIPSSKVLPASKRAAFSRIDNLIFFSLQCNFNVFNRTQTDSEHFL